MFVPDIDPDTTWITSDSHFGHENIIGYCHRPTDHEQIIMEEWAKAVPPYGTLLHLGDLVWKSNGLFKHVISKHLAGAKKYLILGNHDRQRPSFYKECGFKVVSQFEISYGEYRVSFDHYPARENYGKNHIHIHGHIHNNGYGGKGHDYVPFSAGQINVSVEQTHYRPVNLKALLDGYIIGCYEPEPIKEENVEAPAGVPVLQPSN